MRSLNYQRLSRAYLTVLQVLDYRIHLNSLVCLLCSHRSNAPRTDLSGLSVLPVVYHTGAHDGDLFVTGSHLCVSTATGEAGRTAPAPDSRPSPPNAVCRGESG